MEMLVFSHFKDELYDNSPDLRGKLVKLSHDEMSLVLAIPIAIAYQDYILRTIFWFKGIDGVLDVIYRSEISRSASI